MVTLQFPFFNFLTVVAHYRVWSIWRSQSAVWIDQTRWGACYPRQLSCELLE